jgi:voltage-dependent potassium channel beta subunit
MMAAAWDHGVNFFDNAEVYAKGESERIMGAALKKLKWPREKVVVSTKFYWGLNDGPNERNTLNRKYLLQAMDGSLKRLNMDFVDLAYCHRPDPHTPIEETVWAMSDMVTRGKALYWGTSEWSADEIRAAWLIADKHHLHKPVVEQPQYNLFHRKRVEKEYARLYEDCGIGLTTWSPLASGLLSGKYRKGIPKGSRGALENTKWLADQLIDKPKNNATDKLERIAKELGCTLSQLAIAWCAKNPNVSTVITGASKLAQVKENMKAVEVIAKLTPEVVAKIEEITAPLAG